LKVSVVNQEVASIAWCNENGRIFLKAVQTQSRRTLVEQHRFRQESDEVIRSQRRVDTKLNMLSALEGQDPANDRRNMTLKVESVGALRVRDERFKAASRSLSGTVEVNRRHVRPPCKNVKKVIEYIRSPRFSWPCVVQCDIVVA
jgi:hypothetical protein